MTLDKRDPLKLGEALLEVRAKTKVGTGNPVPLHVLYDSHPSYMNVGDSSSDPVNHAEERMLELRHRALEGDKYARALLNGDSLAEDD